MERTEEGCGKDVAVVTCDGCEEPITDDDGSHIDVDGVDWHESCYEAYGESTTSYCCGSIYEEGEAVCASCGDPL